MLSMMMMMSVMMMMIEYDDDDSIQTTSIQLEIHQSHHRLIASIPIMMIKMMVMKYCQANRCLDD